MVIESETSDLADVQAQGPLSEEHASEARHEHTVFSSFHKDLEFLSVRTILKENNSEE